MCHWVLDFSCDNDQCIQQQHPFLTVSWHTKPYIHFVSLSFQKVNDIFGSFLTNKSWAQQNYFDLIFWILGRKASHNTILLTLNNKSHRRKSWPLWHPKTVIHQSMNENGGHLHAVCILIDHPEYFHITNWQLSYLIQLCIVRLLLFQYGRPTTVGVLYNTVKTCTWCNGQNTLTVQGGFIYNANN